MRSEIFGKTETPVSNQINSFKTHLRSVVMNLHHVNPLLLSGKKKKKKSEKEFA